MVLNGRSFKSRQHLKQAHSNIQEKIELQRQNSEGTYQELWKLFIKEGSQAQQPKDSNIVETQPDERSTQKIDIPSHSKSQKVLQSPMTVATPKVGALGTSKANH